MKKLILASIGIATNLLAVDIPPPIPINTYKKDPYFQKFSDKALELISIYAPRLNSPRTFYHPPLDFEKHVNEKYRIAWEEIYCEVVTNGLKATKIAMAINQATVLSMMGSTNSIPVLVDAYKEMQKKDTYYQAHHLAILGILLHIDAPEAMDAVFKLLDYTDVELGADKKYQNVNETLRERIMNVLLDPKFDPKRLESFKPVKTPEALRAQFDAYQKPDLSARNQAFIEKTRAVSRAAEEAKEQEAHDETPPL